jgi:hypothetical protein
MANLGALYTSLLNRVKEITQLQFVHIWNNQLQQLADGETYVYPFPCAFVEILTPADYLPLGGGFSVADITVRIHIGHEEYDAGGGNFEQNVNVFTYRDLVVNKLNLFQPTGASSLMRSAELQDYVHTNIYHYQIDFRTAFVDTAGVQEGGVEGIITAVDFNPVTGLDSGIKIEATITGQENEPYREIIIN